MSIRWRCDVCRRRRCQDCDGEAWNAAMGQWVTCGCECRAKA